MRLLPGEPAATAWQSVPVREFAADLLAGVGAVRGRPVVVAVDGRSGSGKTTVARRIAGAMPHLPASAPAATVVHSDDVAWHHSVFGWDGRLVDGVLRPVHDGRAVTFRPRAWEERGRDGAIAVPAGCRLLIVEGVGAGRRELKPCVDALLWVQADFDESERRGVARDGGTPAAAAFWAEWMREEVPFLAAQRPWLRAEAFVAGTQVSPSVPATHLEISRRGGGS